MREMVAAFCPRDERVWDALWQNKSIGRLAVAVDPCEERIASVRETSTRLNDLPGENETWRQSLRDELILTCAYMQLPGDYCPVLRVPGSVHGQSQGICDVFGAKLEPHPQEKGLLHVCPLPADPGWVDDLVVRPLETSRFWGAVEWIRYARAATEEVFEFRNPVMTGPLDTVNYLLGTTVLMEWMYGEPKALHGLLNKITPVIIEMLQALQHAAGGRLAGEDFYCMRGGPCLCSECRSLISREHYAEFEAPYLRRIGREFGTYGFHSCGNWERTVPSNLMDSNLRVMHGQIRENDLTTLCRLADGRKTLAVGPSENLDTRYTWRDRKEFYDHVLTTVPADQPIEIRVREADVPYLNEKYAGSPLWKPLEIVA